MPASQSIKLQSPLKGVNRAWARDAQPDNTCWDAKNMLPFDRQGRMRIEQRGGVAVQADLGTASSVRLLHLASAASIPSTSSDATVDTVYEPFDNSIGFSVSANLEAINFDARTWDVGTSNSSGGIAAYLACFNGTRTGTFTPTAGGVVQPMFVDHATSFIHLFDAYTQAVTAVAMNLTSAVSPADNFRVVMGGEQGTFSPNPDSSTVIYYVSARVDFTDPDGDTTPVLTAEWFTGTVRLYKDSTLLASASTSIAVSPRSLVLQILGDTVQVQLMDAGSVATTLISHTVAGQDTTRRGVAFGASTGTQQGNLTGPKATCFSVDTMIPGTEGSVLRTSPQIVAVSSDTTFVGGSPATVAEVVNSASYPVSTSSLFISAATLFGFTYIVDGTQILSLNLSSDLFETFTESAGTAPTGCTIAANWRGRLVLSGDTTDPQNFFASRAGDPLDWDYSQTDPTAAFAGNAAPSGRVGEPITALIPASDDTLIIGCEQSIWIVRNDPTDGGSIDNISNATGIMGQNAWCRGPEGFIYFLGENGFYRISITGGEPEDLSRTTWPQFFNTIDHPHTYTNLVYDKSRYGVWIFLSPTTVDDAPGTSIFYDLRMQGFWPIEYTNLPTIGPVAAIAWEKFNSDSRFPLLGSYDGVLYWVSSLRKGDQDVNDDAFAIDSYVVLGPVHAPDNEEAAVIGTTLVFGELLSGEDDDFFHATATLRAGKTAYDVTEGTAIRTATADFVLDRRAKTMRQKVRGEWFSLKLANSTVSEYFEFESAFFEFAGSGRNRKQR